ncbi:30S ribosomal protein S1 [Bacillus thermotolerans]|uniref:SSU ribosomal protein S1p n=1 Tax=Bacillus thermotolerans TaxID=1221996 RepID=A0A0F5HYZ9_BACTR|nr:30S ribosomal protein S1 [Bacillus thermotolerans]KKB37955.1 SSU ribosomal protein S1p [Bacillus thermotolerans]KKB37964.1 SSU ribosomal protein S1p [Bacillus thermotolerans]KKB38438.1 SSU ribosomal protein S1p [Bacillus thermotolerans]
MTEDMNQAEVNNYEVGDKVNATVVKVEEKQVQVEIEGSKKDGIIPISELSSLHVEKASDVVNEGDQLVLQVTKEEDDLYVLSKRKADAETAWEEAKRRFESGEVFEAEVKEVVKGGLVVDLGIRGFIPASLVEDHYVEDFEDYKGKTMSFKIVELEQEKNRLILSHRAVLDMQKSEQKQKVLSEIEAGDVLDGKVQRLTDFGAFVDIGGVDGLVHISQLSHEHVEKPSDVLEEGQEVKVKVLSVDRDNERISLSIKETLPGPWTDIADKAPVGSELTGKVKRLVSYGAFVEVFPGVEGLVHISQISNRHIGTPHEVLEEGQEVKVKVLDVNEEEKRLSLTMKPFDEQAQQEEESYSMPEENTGFSLSEMIGDQLKGLKRDE